MHVHVVVSDGVFALEDDWLRFPPATEPSSEEIAALSMRIRRRVLRSMLLLGALDARKHSPAYGKLVMVASDNLFKLARVEEREMTASEIRGLLGVLKEQIPRRPNHPKRELFQKLIAAGEQQLANSNRQR